MLLIRTRFTWYYLLILGMIAAYSLYAIPYQLSTQIYSFGTLYFTGIVGVYSIVSAYMGGITVSKSDQEFLLVSPIPRKDLITGFLLVQALGAGLLLIAVSIFALTFLDYSPLEFVFAALNLAVLDVFLMTVGIASFQFARKWRILIGAGIAAWVLSFFLNFPLAPQNFMIGAPYYPLLLSTPIAALSLFGAIRSLSHDDLPIRVSSSKESKTTYRSTVSYLRYSPRRAVFMNGLTNLSYSTNSLQAGGIRTRTTKISIRTYYIIIVIIAVAYASLAYLLIPYGIQDVGFNLVVLFGALYAGVIPQFMFNSGVITYERAWLSFTSMEPWRYISIIIGSKVFQSMLTSIPFIVVSLVDYMLGVLNTIESILVFLVLDPLLIGLYLFINFSVSSYQVTDEGYISARMGASQFIPALPLILFTMVVMIAILVPILIVFTSLASGLILLYAVTRRNYWERRLYRLVEKGYT